MQIFVKTCESLIACALALSTPHLADTLPQ